MSHSSRELSPFRYETVEFEPMSERSLHIRGQIAIQEPSKFLQPYVLSVHEALLATKVPEFEVDVTALTFINSSAIRLFIDWATWVSEGGRPYKLVFRTNRASTWQRVAFAAIVALAGDAVEIAPVAL